MRSLLISKIIRDIRASKGKRKGCHGLNHLLETDGYISSIVNWVSVTKPERIDSLVDYTEELERKIEALAAENVALKDTLEHVVNPDNQPEYHDQGMGCGVEDRGYQRDGYAACYYGWESAMERVYSEVIPDAIPETPATDAALAEIRAQSTLALDQLPVDEDFWSAVNDIIYQTDRHGFTNVHLGRSDAKSLALWISDVLPLRKEAGL